jgi:hypothetical protein
MRCCRLLAFDLTTLIVVGVLTAACETGTRPSPFVIPGPAVRDSPPTDSPYVWDSRQELEIWVRNTVSRGSITLIGSGVDAFIRIEPAENEWLLRGPDLSPSATVVQTLRIRYRWRPASTSTANPGQTISVRTHFQSPRPIVGYDPLAQGVASTVLAPRDDWSDTTFEPSNFRPPIEVLYSYLHSNAGIRGALEIDRIELVR